MVGRPPKLVGNYEERIWDGSLANIREVLYLAPLMQSPIQIELPTVYGMKTVNAWLFVEPEPVLIDCGEQTDASWHALLAGLAKAGLELTDLSRLVITHAHVDHIGMAGEIAAKCDAEIWVSDYVLPWAVDPQTHRLRRFSLINDLMNQVKGNADIPMQQVFQGLFDAVSKAWTSVPLDRIRTFAIDGMLEMGGQDWQVIHAPGHCINQTCFYAPASRWLLSADMLLSITPSPVVDLSPDPPYKRVRSLQQLLTSFQRFRELEIDQVFPGHYEPFGNPKPLIEQQVNRIHSRKEEVLSLINAGKSDFMSLFRTLYANPMNLPGVPMLWGYLDLLEAEGRVISHQVSDQLIWSST